MTKNKPTAPSDDSKKPTGGWQYFGSEKTLQALARRDELQAETVAAAMRALERQGDPNQRELKRLRREVRRLRQINRTRNPDMRQQGLRRRPPRRRRRS